MTTKYESTTFGNLEEGDDFVFIPYRKADRFRKVGKSISFEWGTYNTISTTGVIKYNHISSKQHVYKVEQSSNKEEV